MADDFLTLLKSRRTMYEYSSKKVKAKDINSILEAARWSPSCANSQPWHFIVVKDMKMIEELMLLANYGDFHTLPPLMIACVLINKKCAGEGFACFRGKDAGVHDNYMSVGMACLNMALEAKELGLDSCILTPKPEEVKKILKVSKQDAVPLVIGIGYPSKDAFEKKRERAPLKEIVSYEKMGGRK